MRAETPMLGIGWRGEVRVTRTPLVDALIGQGRLVVLATYDDDGGEHDGGVAGGVQVDAAAPAAADPGGPVDGETGGGYDAGGILPPGPDTAVDAGGADEPVTPAGGPVGWFAPGA